VIRDAERKVAKVVKRKEAVRRRREAAKRRARAKERETAKVVRTIQARERARNKRTMTSV